MKERIPAVAGTFYEGSEKKLKNQIEECFLSKIGVGKLPEVNPKGDRKIFGLICPHAGYMYSGPVASHGFYELAKDGIPSNVIILGPNHHGTGKSISVSKQDFWQTPLGKIEINKKLIQSITADSNIVYEDDAAHLLEHSIEVQLPFLQYLYGNKFKLVPISMADQSLESCMELGRSIADEAQIDDILVIASTDLTHYEDAQTAKRKDSAVIKNILDLDADKMYETILKQDISMCGPGPVAVLISAAEVVGANKTQLLKYANSGDTSGDYGQVVGYATITFCK